MKTLAADYWALDESEYQKMLQLGEHARDLHAQGLPNYPMHSRRAMAKKGVGVGSQMKPFLDVSADDRSHFMKKIFEGKSTLLPPLLQEQEFEIQFQVLTRAFARDMADENSKEETEAQEKLTGLLSSTAHEGILQDRRRLKELRAAKFVAMPHKCPALSCSFVPEQVVPPSWTSTHACANNDQRLSPNTLAEAWGSHHKGLRDNEAAFHDPGFRAQALLGQ